MPLTILGKIPSSDDDDDDGADVDDSLESIKASKLFLEGSWTPLGIMSREKAKIKNMITTAARNQLLEGIGL